MSCYAGARQGASRPGANEKYAAPGVVADLLKTQRGDGSWFVKSRSKPVQVYFDNGDPHERDQFIPIY